MSLRSCFASATLVVGASLGHAAPALAEPTKQECVDLNEHAQSLRQQGDARAARASLVLCLDPACPAPVRQDCGDQIAEMDQTSSAEKVHVAGTLHTTPVLSTQRTTGEVLVVTGAAGIVVGAVLGIVAKVTYDSALSSQCHGSAAHCSASGVDDVSTAHAEALGSTVAFVAGPVALVTGTALWVTARRSLQVTPTRGGATFGLSGAF